MSKVVWIRYIALVLFTLLAGYMVINVMWHIANTNSYIIFIPITIWLLVSYTALVLMVVIMVIVYNIPIKM